MSALSSAAVAGAQSRLVAEAHRSATEAQPQYMAASLNDALGSKLVAYIVGAGDAKTVNRWARNERTPSAAHEERLRTTFYIFQLLNEMESSHTVRAWFSGLNPLLADESPASTIRDGKLKEALAAAKAFVLEG